MALKLSILMVLSTICCFAQGEDIDLCLFLRCVEHFTCVNGRTDPICVPDSEVIYERKLVDTPEEQISSHRVKRNANDIRLCEQDHECHNGEYCSNKYMRILQFMAKGKCMEIKTCTNSIPDCPYRSICFDGYCLHFGQISDF